MKLTILNVKFGVVDGNTYASVTAYPVDDYSQSDREVGLKVSKFGLETKDSNALAMEISRLGKFPLTVETDISINVRDNKPVILIKGIKHTAKV